MIRIFAVAHPVRSLGPGLRVAVWTTGCFRDCPGCISPELQPLNAGRPAPVDVLARKLAGLSADIEGLTLSGGEPLIQAEPLGRLLQIVLDRRPEWNILLYTGYTLEEALALGADVQNVLDRVDVVIDGPYRKEQPSRRPLAGSGNQRFHFLTDKGKNLAPQLASMNRVRYDLGLGPGGQGLVVGVGSGEARSPIQEWLKTFSASDS
jgi:anaerobic ribonucleoside-triphosphate reductase activating protein